MRRHYLQNEAEAEKDAARPPAGFGQKISSLSDSDECVGRRAGAAEACRETAALPALQEDGGDQHQTIEDQQGQKKRVNH